MEMGRSGFLPAALGRVNAKTRTPIAALFVNLAFGVIAILSGRTGEIITLACFGAVSLYIVSMISLIILRKKEPDLERPYRAVAYPLFPLTALVLSVVTLIAFVIYNPEIAALFAGILVLGFVYYTLVGKNRVNLDAAS